MAPADKDKNGPGDDLPEGESVSTVVDDDAKADTSDGVDDKSGDGKQEPEPMTLDIEIDAPSTCQRHITVTISGADVVRYRTDAFSKMMPTAQVPGFRVGKAPLKLVEARFRKEVNEQVKGSLLMDSMSQVNEDRDLAVISEPEIDLDAVEVPDEGPLTFEFDVEVRPEFDMPDWKGLTLERPTREIGKDEIDKRLSTILASSGELAPTDKKAKAGDFITCKLTFQQDGEELSSSDEETICIRPELSFRDGIISNFGKTIAGVMAGETKELTADVGDSAQNEALRGKKVTVVFDVLEVKRFELPEITPDLLEDLGDFDSEGDLRDAIQDDLQRQMEYHQKQRAREQISGLLIEGADWELPPEMLKRQSMRELERSLMELQRSGFDDDYIRAHANQLRQNSQMATAKSLKEHFILERIAESEDIDAVEEDYDQEIALIAMQSNQNPRRVRAQLERRGLMDVLRNQIIERRVIERVMESAKFKDTDYESDERQTSALDLALGGDDTESDIPEAKHTEAEKLRVAEDHT